MKITHLMLMASLVLLLSSATAEAPGVTFAAPVLVCENCSWPDTYSVMRPGGDSAVLMGFAHGSTGQWRRHCHYDTLTLPRVCTHSDCTLHSPNYPGHDVAP